MMRPHCDRCDMLCEAYPSWIEDDGSPLDVFGAPMTSSSVKPIRHLFISGGGSTYAEEKMFCRACRVTILEAHVKALKFMKGENGHLVDCMWNVKWKRYDCAEGCAIKRINEVHSIP